MPTNVVEEVRSRYGSVARSGLSGDQAGVRAVAEAFGYSAEELAAIPAEANMGLSCGNPTATANLRPGEVVVDLGCGGGLDVLLAAPKVGPTGKAIGIDMTADMIELAKKNAAKAGAANVEFHLATIDKLPLPAGSVDCLISNCVLNLAPDKPAAFREMFRVLKPGGRVAVSDIALKKPLPLEVSQDVLAYVGCIAGAILIADYEQGLRDAGFDVVQVVDAMKDLNAYAQVENQAGCCGSGCGSSELHAELADLVGRYDANEFAASVRVFALKPAKPDDSASQPKEKAMATLQVFDKPMCCSTGVCGPEVDPVLPKFAADLAWLKTQGIAVERFNLAQEPQAFGACADVKAALAADYENALPLVRVNGKIVSRGAYPSREQLASWCAAPQARPLAMAEPAGGSCCGATGCC